MLAAAFTKNSGAPLPQPNSPYIAFARSLMPRVKFTGPEPTFALLKTELLAGLTVALALVPEAVAFAFVAGVHPLVGLYAAFMVGLITAVMGGRPGMISGATGALAVVMVALVAEHGVEYLFATVVLMGILQVIAGAMHWGRFIRLVPHPVMLGFVNGLAIVIFLMHRLMRELEQGTRRALVGTAVIIFAFRAVPLPGPGATWFEIDVLEFDQQFISILTLITGWDYLRVGLKHMD